jgi:antitoxin CptB
MSDDLDTRRRRAAYRAGHRGTKEMDWILGRYATSVLATMHPAQLAVFEELLALPDPLLQDMILHQGALPDGEVGALIMKLRAFHGLCPAHDGQRGSGPTP